MLKNKDKIVSKPKKIMVKSEVIPLPAGMKEYRENILLSFFARYHIARQSRKFH